MKRNQIHEQSAIKIQSNVRGFLTRKKFKQNIRSVVIIQSFIRMLIARGEYMRLKKSTVVLQKHWRGVKGRRRVAALKEDKARAVENRNRILTTGAVGHLEIPAQLAFSLHRLAGEFLYYDPLRYTLFTGTRRCFKLFDFSHRFNEGNERAQSTSVQHISVNYQEIIDEKG